MSPLIDVTNTVGQDSSVDDLGAGSTRKTVVRVPRAHPSLPDASGGQGEGSGTGLMTYSKVRSGAVAIKMCNTQVSGSGSSASSAQGLTQMYNCTKNPLRVPPLPCTSDVLSQAVEALSLDPLSTRRRRCNRRRLSRQSKEIAEPSDKSTTQLQNGSGEPENSGGGSGGDFAPQQCGACGLEFTSLSVLTQHLARHVYDGLYAAQWLNQAMNLVLARRDPVPTSQTDTGGGGESPSSQDSSSCD